MTITIEPPDELAAKVAADAACEGISIEDYTLRALRLSRFAPPILTPEQLMRLPVEERNWHLALQAEDAASLYIEDLAKPIAERELTAFTALDGEPLIEHYCNRPLA